MIALAISHCPVEVKRVAVNVGLRFGRGKSPAIKAVGPALTGSSIGPRLTFFDGVDDP
jgi:hypothetical protein